MVFGRALRVLVIVATRHCFIQLEFMEVEHQGAPALCLECFAHTKVPSVDCNLHICKQSLLILQLCYLNTTDICKDTGSLSRLNSTWSREGTGDASFGAKPAFCVSIDYLLFSAVVSRRG